MLVASLGVALGRLRRDCRCRVGSGVNRTRSPTLRRPRSAGPHCAAASRQSGRPRSLRLSPAAQRLRGARGPRRPDPAAPRTGRRPVLPDRGRQPAASSCASCTLPPRAASGCACSSTISTPRAGRPSSPPSPSTPTSRCAFSIRCRCAAAARARVPCRCTSSSASTAACTTSCSSPTAAGRHGGRNIANEYFKRGQRQLHRHGRAVVGPCRRFAVGAVRPVLEFAPRVPG